MTEEQLEARVVEALGYHMMNGSEFTPEGKPTPSVYAIYQAEDRLAQWQFKRDVDEEMKRIESVVDNELKRIEGLNREISPHEQCYKCKTNLYNTLAMTKKFGCDIGSINGFSHCCGKPLCNLCVASLNSSLASEPSLKCKFCSAELLWEDSARFEALERFANQKIPW